MAQLRLLAPNRYARGLGAAAMRRRASRALLRELRGQAMPVCGGDRLAAPLAARRRRARRRAHALRAAARSPNPRMQIGVRLNADSTFEPFVEGKSNHFAKAAAMQVAENPGQGLQPAVHLRRHGPGQDAPDAGRRACDQASAIRMRAWPMCIRSASSTTWCRRCGTTP